MSTSDGAWSPLLPAARPDGTATGAGAARFAAAGLRFRGAAGPFALLDTELGDGSGFRRAAAAWLEATSSGCLTVIAVVEQALPADLADRVKASPEPGLPDGFDEAWLEALPPPHVGTFLLRPIPGRVHLLLLQDDRQAALDGLAGPIDASLAHDLPTGRPASRRGSAVTVVGAGLAGACVARLLADHEVDVTVVDRGPPPGTPGEPLRGSSNPWLMCRPHLAAGPHPLAALTRASWMLRDLYGDALTPLSGFVMGPRDGKLTDRHTKITERWRGSPWLAPLPPLGPPFDEGYHQLEAGVLDGARAVANLLDGLDVHWNTEAPAEGPRIWCTGTPREGRWSPVAGSVVRTPDRRLPPGLAVAAGHYAIDVADGTVVGATRHRGRSVPADAPASLPRAAHERLGLTLGAPVSVWRGVRAKTPDHLPVVGLVGDDAVSAGHGSKGSATAPICAALVVAQWLGLPWPVPRAVAAALAPDRRALKP
ncbi:MAG: FAD-dependent oxidoreductase [Myxococcota bacterium]